MSPFQPPNQPANRQPISFPGAAGPRHVDPDDLVLYAMQLLPEDDAATITSHLEQCDDCRAELARVHDDLAVYASSVDVKSPPAAARQRLIQQVAREKKIVSTHRPAQSPSRICPSPPLAAALCPSPRRYLSPTAPLAAPSSSGPVGASQQASPWPWDSSIGDRSTLRDNLALQASQIQHLNADAASAHQLMDALTDPKAVRVALTITPQLKAAPIGGVTYNPEKGTLIFLASNLDPLQALKTYELWVIPADGSAPVPAGTFHPDDQGNASVIMPDLPKGVAAKAFGVTVEPDGGSQTPTLPIIMSGS